MICCKSVVKILWIFIVFLNLKKKKKKEEEEEEEPHQLLWEPINAKNMKKGKVTIFYKKGNKKV